MSISSLPGSAGSLKTGQYVSIRFWRQGSRIVATSIHVYAHVPVPRATAAIKGTVTEVAGSTVAVHAAAATIVIQVPSFIHIRDGSHLGELDSIKVGETVSVCYYVQGSNSIATSIHIYAQASLPKATGKFKGAVISVTAMSFNVRASDTTLLIQVPSLTHIRDGSHPGSMQSIKVGKTVSVRYYRQGSKLVATSIHVYSQAPIPKATGEIKGTVTSVSGAMVGVRASANTLLIEVPNVTHIRDGSHLGSMQSIKVGKTVSVRYYRQGSKLVATSIHVYSQASIPKATGEIKGAVTSVSGAIVGVHASGKTLLIEVPSVTHIRDGSHLGYLQSIKVGETVSVRYFKQGSTFVATSIHIYASALVPKATGVIKGTVGSVTGSTLVIRAGTTTLTILVPSITHIRDGSHLGNLQSIKVGETVSVRYYTQGIRAIATSIHIYAVSAKKHTLTGTILSTSGTQLKLLDRGSVRIVEITATTTIHDNGVIVLISALKTGERVRVTATETQSLIVASRIDVLALVKTKAGNLPSAFKGELAQVGPTSVVLIVTSGQRVTISLSASTKVMVRKHSVPVAWLFAGPTADVSVQPSASPSALQIDFHAASKTFTGDIASVAGQQMVLDIGSAGKRTVDLSVATVTDDGNASDV